jgi:hypothetical protein
MLFFRDIRQVGEALTRTGYFTGVARLFDASVVMKPAMSGTRSIRQRPNLKHDQGEQVGITGYALKPAGRPVVDYMLINKRSEKNRIKCRLVLQNGIHGLMNSLRRWKWSNFPARNDELSADLEPILSHS